MASKWLNGLSDLDKICPELCCLPPFTSLTRIKSQNSVVLYRIVFAVKRRVCIEHTTQYLKNSSPDNYITVFAKLDNITFFH